MVSTFHGLETAKRALTTQQSALYTTGHNIANANTAGYTRQRVSMQTTEPYPSPGFNQPKITGQLGTGVKAGEVERIRNSFTDMQYRTENSKLGYWQAKSEMLTQVEDVMNELDDTGLSSAFDDFWKSLQDLATQPQNDGARRVVRENGVTLANTFNYMYNTLKNIQIDYRNEIDSTEDTINSILRQINSLNQQIASVEPHGYLPNDLYDKRDQLVDDLSQYLSIRVEKKSSGGLASANADGLYDIYLATPDGEILKDSNGKAIKLVDSSLRTAFGIHITYDKRSESDSPVSQIKFLELSDDGFKGINSDIEADYATAKYQLNGFNEFKNQGALKGYIEGYGFLEKSNGKTTTLGTLNDMLADLDQTAYTFATYFNYVHKSGWSLNDIQAYKNDSNYEKEGHDFFDIDDTVKGYASRIKVSDKIINDVQNIAASAAGNVISETMKYTGNNANTVGSPVFIGFFDASKIDKNNKNDWENANQIKVTVQYSEITPGNGTWNCTIQALDKDNNPINTLKVENNFTSLKELYGIFKIDLSNVSEVNNGDTWTITFSPKGMKSGDEAYIGDGSNALALANVKDATLNYGGTLTNVSTFYQGVIGKLGQNASEANSMTETASTLKGNIEERRQSESSVSLDEEMISMIKYQHAYNAAARNITMIDEMLDRIINSMGTVGR